MTTAPETRALELEFALPERSRRLRLKSVSGLIAPGFVLVVFVVTGLLAPLISPHDPEELVLTQRLQPPAWQGDGAWSHPLGTDNLGRDILSRVIHGAQISLLVVGICVPLSAGFGTLMGVIAGWRLGFFDKFMMRVVDVQLAMPAILFAVLLAAVYGPSLRNVIIIIIVWTWSGYARLVRGEALSLRERDFVTASRAIGAGGVTIVARHIVPNVLNAVVILATLEIAQVILIEAAMSFLGIGVAIGTPSWGAMVSEGRDYMTLGWWLVAMPGLAIVVVSLAGNLAGDWLRDAIDPRMRNIR